MEEKTTGQKLLASLHASTAVRTERYANTVASKMKDAREKLPGLEPKHPINASDLTLFSNAESEVHRLLPDATNKQPGLAGITSMLVRKADRHEAAWQQYLASRDLAQQQHDAAAAAAAAALKAQLDGVDSAIEQGMSVLAEDRVMVLDEQQIVQVWESVVQRCATTASWIDGLAAAFQAAEGSYKASVEAALRVMVADMCDIAHLDEGRVQRLMEQEATALNMALLDNRQVAADVLQHLHAQQVLLEQSRRQRWEAAFAAWRTLRSRHAVRCFSEHVQRDSSEPAARLHLFVHLRASQEEAHRALLQLCRKVGQLLPPHLTSEAVAAWVGDAKQWNAQWQQQVAAHLKQLQEQEDQMEKQIQSDLAALRSEVLNYKGFTAEEVEQLLQQETEALLTSRRETAQQLLRQTAAFLDRQAAEWQVATQVLASWLTSLVSLFEDHKARVSKSEASIKAMLRASRQQFEQEDADREEVLDASILAVSQGNSESVLDERVETALSILVSIVSGYRAYAAAANDSVSQYPGSIKQQCEVYMRCLCGLLHVQAPEQQQAAGAGAGADAALSSPVQQQQLGTPAAGDGRPPSQQQQLQQQSTQRQQLDVPGGATYSLLHELWAALWGATPKPWKKQQRQQEQEGTAEANSQPDAPAAASRPTSGSAAVVASSSPTPPAAGAGAAKAAAASSAAGTGGKLTAKQQQQLAEAAAAAEAAALAAAEATAAAAAVAAAAADAPPPCPAAFNGMMLCQQLDVPGDVVQASLQQLQVSLLAEMEAFSARCVGSADSWCESVEQMVTEELDGRLRAHRPRAGRIEEEVRAARSIELLAQRRRVEGHMRSQSKAVKQQAATFDEATRQLRADAAAWRSKLLGYERLLGNALSLKGIDIVWREAQALRVRQDRQLVERLAELREQVVASCGSVVAANRRFEADNLKSFQEGGKYAQENVDTYKAGMSGIDHHMAAQQQQQEQQLEALQQELSADLSAALSTIEQLLPSHKQDMTLIEALNRYVEGAKKKATSELSKNSQAGEIINSALQRLQDSLARAAEPQPEAAPEPGPVDKPGQLQQQQQPGQPAALKECQQLLGHVNELRQQLLKQAQVLELLQSSGLANTTISLSVTTELQPLVLPDFSTISAAAAAATDAAAAAKGPAGRPGTGQKGPAGRPGSSGATPARASSPAKQTPSAGAAGAALAAAGSGQVCEALGVPLAKDIRTVIDAAKQEVDAAAKTYYAAKDASRPITYPTKIAASSKELMAGVDAVLAGLTHMMQQHMVTAAKQLRVQAVEAHRLLERVPAAVLLLLSHHLLAAVGQQHSRLLGEFAARRALLEQQLEQHKTSLHPSMLHPSRRSELEGLKSSEAVRQAAAADLTAACAAACLALSSSHASQVSGAVAELCRLLLSLLDGWLMPGDLVAPPEGDDALAGVAQRSMVQLQRLALAQDEAVPAGPAVPAAPVPAAASSKGSSKAQVGKAADAGGDAPGQAVARPFPYVSWHLAAGNFSLTSLGWLPEDQQAVGAAAAGKAGSTAPVQQAAQVAAPGAAGSPQKATAAAASTALQQQQQQQQQRPKAEAGAVVTGYDTPCQRAVIRAQRAALHRTELALAAAVQTLKQQLYQWVGQEQQWGGAWARMIDELDMV